MRKPHFFKAYCRIGIQNLPYGQSEAASGVEEAPDKILDDQFLKRLNDPPVSVFGFKIPEEIPPLNYFQTVLEELLKFRDLLLEQTKRDEVLVVVGGDHSITYASILYDIKHHGKEMGIIHFDSHADFNLYKTSPSQNFHGMHLRIFFDKFDLPYFDKTVPKKLPLSNLLFIGNLELDTEEFEFINENGIDIVSSDDAQKKQTLEEIQKFVNKFNHIHVSFDVDVFDKNLVNATSTPSKNGFGRKEIFYILDLVGTVKSLTLDIVEVNPRKKGAKETIKITQEIILKLLN